MKKFLYYSKKFCIKELVLITFVCFFFFIMFYGKQNVFLVDVGREAYIPWQMLKGQLLYKDIFNVYGPLGYQINAIAYAILGVKLNTLYIMGVLNSLLILISTFFIAHLFIKKKYAIIVSALTLFVCVFTVKHFNFIYPYSYSAVYALTGFLFSLLAMLLYMQKDKKLYLYLSFLFAGFSFANKIENLPYFAMIFLVLPFFLKRDWKEYFKATVAFMVFPIISFGGVLAQGTGINDIINAVELIKKLLNAKTTEFFYYNYGLYLNKSFVFHAIQFTLLSALIFLPYIASYFLVNFINQKYLKNKIIKFFLNSIVFVSLFYCANSLSRHYTPISGTLCNFGIICVFISVISLCFLSYKAINAKNIGVITNQDKMFLFLVFAAISVSIKGIANTTTECYGTFSLAALFIPISVFGFKYLPEILPFWNKKAMNKTFANVLGLIILIFFANTCKEIFYKNEYLIKTQTGSIFVNDSYKSTKEITDFINKNTPKDATIVSAPEGVLINFLTQHDSSNMYYYLIPVNVEIFGEDKIIKDFKQNPPDYFLLNNIPYVPFNTGAFCTYAPKTCTYINQNYSLYKTINAPIGFKLYKKK